MITMFSDQLPGPVHPQHFIWCCEREWGCESNDYERRRKPEPGVCRHAKKTKQKKAWQKETELWGRKVKVKKMHEFHFISAFIRPVFIHYEQMSTISQFF